MRAATGAVLSVAMALAAWGCMSVGPAPQLSSEAEGGGVRQAGYIDVACMSGLGVLNRMPCTMTSSKHRAIVRIPPGERVCSVRPAEVSVHRAATSTYAVARDEKGAFVEARAIACPTGPVVLGPPSSVKARWIVTTVAEGRADPLCDYKTAGQLPGPPPAC